MRTESKPSSTAWSLDEKVVCTDASKSHDGQEKLFFRACADDASDFLCEYNSA
uniref:Uncharacterized protein n=1 Tax=Kalanchoe fedtschenkoi TaxID=63787 RepID=A0A7N0TWJ3_KALFE